MTISEREHDRLLCRLARLAKRRYRRAPRLTMLETRRRGAGLRDHRGLFRAASRAGRLADRAGRFRGPSAPVLLFIKSLEAFGWRR